ncbi:MAG: hypothetical protein ABEJ22_07940 [Haloferacaceae archaeon]
MDGDDTADEAENATDTATTDAETTDTGTMNAGTGTGTGTMSDDDGRVSTGRIYASAIAVVSGGYAVLIGLSASAGRMDASVAAWLMPSSASSRSSTASSS